MERKKWTPQPEITAEVLKFREKRKWQLALRRYVIEQNKSPFYAPYFGLSIERFREWIQIQFTEGLEWDNFGSAWQFEHVVPLSYFNFSKEGDLKLCWSFLNIRVEKIQTGKSGVNRAELIAVKPYFEALYNRTTYDGCLQMLEKIRELETIASDPEPSLEHFLIEHREDLQTIATLDSEEFNNLNAGMTVSDLLLQRAILQKFG